MAKFIIEKATITGLEKVQFKNGETSLKLTVEEVVTANGRTFANKVKIEFAGNYANEIPTHIDIIGLECSISGFVSTLEKNDNVYVFLKGKSLVIHRVKQEERPQKAAATPNHEVVIDDYRGDGNDDDLPF